ncbi:MAG: transketolase family protein [Gammaproteobacteria bacterium]
MPSYEDALHRLGEIDERFIVMTAENRAAIRTLPERLGPRFIDVGIAEQTLVGAAAGLAVRGRIPVIHALATFLTLRAFEFIRTDVGIPGLPVKLVGSFPGFLSEANGPTHQAIEDVALMRGIPSMKVFCPADLDDLLIGLCPVLLDPAPYYIRYNARSPVVVHTRDFAPGKAEVLAEGRDATFLTYGVLFSECHQAAERLRKNGLSVGLVNLRTLKPVDRGLLIALARSCRLLVVVEDHFKTGGLYSILAETLLEAGVTAATLCLSLPDRWFKPALYPALLEHEGYTPKALACRVLARLERL